MARLAGRAAPHAGARPGGDRLRGGDRSRRNRHRRPARHGRLEPRARGAAAHVRRRELPRAGHDAPGGDPRARGVARSRADAVRVRIQVRLDAGDALAHRLLLGEDRQARLGVRRRHRPGLGPAAARGGAGLPPCLRGRADDRRPLLRAVGVRHRPGGADGRRRRPAARRGRADGRRLPPRRGQPRLRAGPRVRHGLAGGPRQDLHPRDSGRLRPLGGAADRRVHGQARQGADPRAGRVARRRGPAGRRAADRRSVRARRGVLPLGVRRRRRRRVSRDQPVRPARRPGGEGQDE